MIETILDVIKTFLLANITGESKYYLTLLGSFTGYIFSQQKNFNGSIDFLKKYFPGKGETFYIRLDFPIVVILGSIIGQIVFSPSSPIQALSAGFGWVGAMNTIMSKASDSKELISVERSKIDSKSVNDG
ncbi:MAG: hypothetical protein D3926_08430 [Desulfobacteraceae bacterium]|nr:MAG: hypothetical protein D3926_08430 [Desulfobacteraceae bacterium]